MLSFSLTTAEKMGSAAVIRSRHNACRVRRWGAGVGLAGGAVVAAAMFGVGVAHADESSPADLLDSAITNFNDANDVLSSAGVSDDSELLKFVTSQTGLQDKILEYLDQLESSESTIDSHAGPLSGLFDQLFFTPLDQQWLNASDEVLVGDQAFADAVASGSSGPAGELTAEVGALFAAGADIQLPGLTFASAFVDDFAKLF